MSIRRKLKKIKFIDFIYRKFLKIVSKTTHYSLINVLKTFYSFSPASDGSYRAKSLITINTINNIFPFFEKLIEKHGSKDLILSQILMAEDFYKIIGESEVNLFSELFSLYGSDKSSTHNFQLIYPPILQDRFKIKKILEIGLGTNNEDVVSHMARTAIPGGSLRAFSDFCPNAKIFGADIDERVLFNEGKIKTYKCDQLSTSSLNNLGSKVGKDFDLIIDDGLHSPDANINTLSFGLSLIRKEGWVVIEDIRAHESMISLWSIILKSLDSKKYSTYFIKTRSCYCVAVRRIL